MNDRSSNVTSDLEIIYEKSKFETQKNNNNIENSLNRDVDSRDLFKNQKGSDDTKYKMEIINKTRIPFS